MKPLVVKPVAEWLFSLAEENSLHRGVGGCNEMNLANYPLNSLHFSHLSHSSGRFGHPDNVDFKIKGRLFVWASVGTFPVHEF